MAKQKVEIEVEIPDGHEFVRFDTQYDSSSGEIAVSLPQSVNIFDTYAVCRRAWQWPDWLAANWIAMDGNGIWYAYSDRPTPNSSDGEWYCADGYVSLSRRFINFDPPPCDYWKKSLRQNPRSK